MFRTGLMFQSSAKLSVKIILFGLMTTGFLLTGFKPLPFSQPSPLPPTRSIPPGLDWNLNLLQTGQPDLQLTKQVTGSNHQPGDSVTFTLTVQNTGTATAAGVTVTDSLPAGLSFVSQNNTFGATFSGCSPCSWHLPDLAPGDSGVITLTTQLSSSLPPDFSLVNTAEISSVTPEITLSNNRSLVGMGTFYQYLPLILTNYQPPQPSPEEQLISLINAARAAENLPPLTVSPLLSQVAEAHSQDMVDRHFFSHTNPDGLEPRDRLTNAGYDWWAYGETIGAGYPTPAAMLNGWLSSDGHREILLGNFTEIGLGYVAGGDYGHYWTADFGVPR